MKDLLNDQIISAKPTKVVFTDDLEDRVLSLRIFPDEKRLNAAVEQRSQLSQSVGNRGTHLNIPRIIRASSEGRTHVLLEEMRAAAPDGDESCRIAHLFMALEEMHVAGWVHMDVKPEHFLWCGDHWALHDFDSAMRQGVRFQEREATFAYAPPDIYRMKYADFSDDLYAAALMMYQWQNSGKLPFQLGGLERLAGWIRRYSPVLLLSDQLSDSQREFFRKAFSRQRKSRFQSVEEFQAAWEIAYANRDRREPLGQYK